MPSSAPKKVLITGAGGFAGGFLAAEALRRGCDVTCAVRESTSRKYLADPRLKFLILDFDTPGALSRSIAEALPEGEKWDWIVYNLGATKCLNFADFNRINYEYLRNFTSALQSAGKVPERLLYMSSLSVMGPGDEKNYTPISSAQIPQPNTRYGASKLKAEMWLATCPIPSIIFRSTGIYGPREKDYFLMFKSIAKGWDFSVGMRRQQLTFIYVEDLARAVFDALEKSPVPATYIISEPRAYTQKEFRNLSRKALGKRLVVPVKAPLWILKGVCAIAEKIGVARGKPSTLNRDKYNIMKQRNWRADIADARDGFGFSPQISLEEGIERSINWYRMEGWL